MTTQAPIENPLRVAIQILAERGWTKGTGVDLITQRVCSLGALGLALTTVCKSSSLSHPLRVEAYTKSTTILNEIVKEYSQYQCSLEFNDAPSTQLEDVILVFEKAAARWDEGIFDNSES